MTENSLENTVLSENWEGGYGRWGGGGGTSDGSTCIMELNTFVCVCVCLCVCDLIKAHVGCIKQKNAFENAQNVWIHIMLHMRQDNEGPDQSVHMGSLLKAFAVHCRNHWIL